jgi:hypothetical protein
MQTYRVETTISQNRVLTIRGIPFCPGGRVEVIVLNHPRQANKRRRYPLRGKAVQYARPFDSIAEDDWQALR